MAFFLIITCYLIFLLFSFCEVHCVAKAGRVTDNFHWRYKISRKRERPNLQCGTEIIPNKNLLSMYVRGDSMIKYHIKDRDKIYVSLFMNETSKKEISDHPILVFTIVKHNILDSQYKLRKFISYIDLNNVSWADVYEKNINRIKIPKEEFEQHCNKKMASFEDKKSIYILSETYDENKGFLYSLHPITSLFGTVKYVAC